MFEGAIYLGGSSGVVAELGHTIAGDGVVKAVYGFVSGQAFGVGRLAVWSGAGCLACDEVASIRRDGGE